MMYTLCMYIYRCTCTNGVYNLYLHMAFPWFASSVAGPPSPHVDNRKLSPLRIDFNDRELYHLVRNLSGLRISRP